MVRDIVLGTAQLGQAYGIANRHGQPSVAAAIQLLRLAAEVGIAAFDTAPRYGDAEHLIGRSLTNVPVFTKVDSADVEASVLASLERLRRPLIDVLFLHEPDVVLHDPTGVLTQAEQLLGDCIGALGVSTYTPAEFDAAVRDERISHVQAPVSLADRRLVASGALERAADAGKRVYGRSVLLQGSMLLDEQELPQHLAGLGPMLKGANRISREIGLPLHSLLLAFVGSLPLDGVVIGCDTALQLTEDVRSLRSVTIPDDAFAELLQLPQPHDHVVDPRQWPLQ